MTDLIERIANAVPTNWCDPLLTGDRAIFPKGQPVPAWFEPMLLAIRERVRAGAATALEAAREDSWQPIETAPKDAAVLVTFVAGDIPKGQMTMPGVMVAYWDAYHAPGGNGHDGTGDGWTDAHSGEGCHLHYGYPTHWMPLPAPPAIDAAREEKGDGA